MYTDPPYLPRFLPSTSLSSCSALGASLSTLDFITDVNTIRLYLSTPGLEGYAPPLVVMMGLSMATQLLIVWAQTHKGPKLNMAKDMLLALTALKPGVDAWRVATGQVQNEFQAMEPSMELGMFAS